MKIHPGFIGIDVSKAFLDIFDGTLGATRIANQAAAIRAFLDGLAGRDVFVTFEATGRLDLALRSALAGAGIRFARVNPERARSFARALGLLAKTDAVDARMLALMGQKLEMRVDVPAEPGRQTLASLGRRRDQLVAMRQQERTRLHDGDDVWNASIARILDSLGREIAAVERAIRDLIRAEDGLRRAAALLRGIPGLGPVCTATLLALMPEFGRIHPKAAAALAGLAPFNRDSGTCRGQRTIHGGRKRIRDALYMAANAAIRTPSPFKAFFQSLLDRGKAFKQAVVAVARKLLTVANAVLRDETPYRA